jgi:uncharacterized protein (TIGR02611 family)
MGAMIPISFVHRRHGDVALPPCGLREHRLLMLIRLTKLTYKHGKRVVVAVIGATVVLIGVVMLVTPGPAFVVIPLGLAILATEFVWAKRLLRRLRDAIPKFRDGASRPNANQHRADNAATESENKPPT